MSTAPDDVTVSGVTIEDLARLDARAVACPYPAFARLRESGPVVWSDAIDAWVCTTYDAVTAVLHDTDRFTNKNPGGPQLGLAQLRPHLGEMASSPDTSDLVERFLDVTREPARPVLINADPPEHVRQRRLVNSAFRPARLRAMEPSIATLVDDLIDGLLGDVTVRGDAQSRSVDMVSAFAQPLPMIVIARSLGVPDGDLARFRWWSESMLVQLGNPKPERDEIRDYLTATLEFRSYFSERLARCGAHPGENIISYVATAELDGDRLTPAEQLSILFQFLLAGNDTTAKLLANVIRILCERPDVQHECRNNSSSIEELIEESLRLEPPITGLFRKAKSDVELFGARIKAGDFVWVVYAAANRDAVAFSDPDLLDVDRTNKRDHLTFGHGEHHCIGAGLARTQARIAIARLLERTSELSLTPAANDFACARTFVLRGLTHLHVDVTPA